MRRKRTKKAPLSVIRTAGLSNEKNDVELLRQGNWNEIRHRLQSGLNGGLTFRFGERLSYLIKERTGQRISQKQTAVCLFQYRIKHFIAPFTRKFPRIFIASHYIGVDFNGIKTAVAIFRHRCFSRNRTGNGVPFIANGDKEGSGAETASVHFLNLSNAGREGQLSASHIMEIDVCHAIKEDFSAR
nr:MAG TPA: hypothetical protein [Caudoviricetes sp.]